MMLAILRPFLCSRMFRVINHSKIISIFTQIISTNVFCFRHELHKFKEENQEFFLPRKKIPSSVEQLC